MLLPQRKCFTAVESVYKHETSEFSGWMESVLSFIETDVQPVGRIFGVCGVCQRTDENDCLERYVCLLTPKKIQIVSSLLVSISSRVSQSTSIL
jgi:hypothetical protein